MADISQIKLPNGDTFDLVDEKSGFITGISSSDVTAALGYTPYNGTTNPNGYLTLSTLPIWDGTVVMS